MDKKSTALREVDKPHYKIVQALYLSFFSPQLYVDVGKRWKGTAILYLFFAIIIFASPLSVRIVVDINQFFNTQILNPLKKLPPIIIQNGLVNFDKPMPYMIKNDQGAVVTIVDTTGTITGKSQEYPLLTTLITKNKLYYWPPSPSWYFLQNVPAKESAQPFVQEFPSQVNEVFDGGRWVASSGIENVKHLALAIVYPMIIMMLFVLALIFFLVFAAIAQLAAGLFYQVPLTFKQSMRLLVVSSTPAIAVMFIGFALNRIPPGSGWILLIIVAAYFSFAVIAMRNAGNKMVLR